MDEPAWPWTKPALLQALVLMCFLYWQRHSGTARRRRWRRARGTERGADRRFRAQTGQRWPFNLARSLAESLIKPWAVKTEQTAKPMPENDTHSLSLLYSHITALSSFFFSTFPFHLLAKGATGKVQHISFVGTAESKCGEEKEENEGDEKCMEMSPIHCQAM